MSVRGWLTHSPRPATGDSLAAKRAFGREFEGHTHAANERARRWQRPPAS